MNEETIINANSELHTNDIFITNIKIDYGCDGQNPLEKINFYKKRKKNGTIN